LKLHNKRVLKDGAVIEMKVWEVPNTKNYPEGFKYSLIAVDPVSGSKVLMDNHSPKGHHYHLDDKQLPYSFTNLNKLVRDFKKLTFDHLGVKI